MSAHPHRQNEGRISITGQIDRAEAWLVRSEGVVRAVRVGKAQPGRSEAEKRKVGKSPRTEVRVGCRGRIIRNLRRDRVVCGNRLGAAFGPLTEFVGGLAD